MGHAGDAASAAADVNRFAVALQRKLPAPEANLVYSPFSISAALSMTLAGARGETEAQMISALQLRDSPASVHAAMKELLGVLNKTAPGDKLAIANALWPQRGAPILPEFRSVTRESYLAEAREVDFQRSAEPSRLEINRWVGEHTGGKILELLKPGVITAMTRLVLTNAVYFKGTWAAEFSPRLTRDEPFYPTGGASVSVPMMHREGRYGYLEDGAVQVLEMPYQGNRLAMVVLLPARKDGLAQLEAGISAEQLERWTAGAMYRRVDVTLPRFKMQTSFSLNEALAQLGMKNAFSNAADFSGINASRNLYLSAVVHEAVIEVNEEGTEAAAATGGVINITSAETSRPAVFRADHPFFYLIRDRQTKCIVFAGRVANPKS